MGAVCSAGMVEGNAELGGKTLGFSGKLKKENSFMNRKDTLSGSRSNGQQGKKHKKQETGFSNEFSLSNSASRGEKQVPFILLI